MTNIQEKNLQQKLLDGMKRGVKELPGFITGGAASGYGAYVAAPYGFRLLHEVAKIEPVTSFFIGGGLGAYFGAVAGGLAVRAAFWPVDVWFSQGDEILERAAHHTRAGIKDGNDTIRTLMAGGALAVGVLYACSPKNELKTEPPSFDRLQNLLQQVKWEDRDVQQLLPANVELTFG
jgi:hypothetical protein